MAVSNLTVIKFESVMFFIENGEKKKICNTECIVLEPSLARPGALCRYMELNHRRLLRGRRNIIMAGV